jgi:hypothetical protein
MLFVFCAVVIKVFFVIGAHRNPLICFAVTVNEPMRICLLFFIGQQESPGLLSQRCIDDAAMMRRRCVSAMMGRTNFAAATLPGHADDDAATT